MKARVLYCFAVTTGFFLGCSVGDPNESVADALPGEMAVRIQRAGEYDPNLVADLEQLKSQTSDNRERAGIDLLILGHYGLPGSPVSSEEVRAGLEELSDLHSGSWVSALAKLVIAGIHVPSDSHSEKIEILESVLNDPGLVGFGDTENPFIAPFLHEGETKEAVRSPEDFVRFILVAVHALGYDLPSAESVADDIESEYWQGQVLPHIERLRQVDEETLNKRRRRFIEMQGDGGSP